MSNGYRTNLYTLFAARVEAGGDTPALRFPDGKTTSWRSLAAKADAIARYLSQKGVCRNDVVALFHGKGEDGYALMLACLRLGAVVVNLDMQNPVERLAHILDICRPVQIFFEGAITESAARACGTWGRAALDIGKEQVADGERTELPPPSEVIGTDIAYIMFTSGSTGIPKGVAIAHAQVLNLIDWAAEEFGIRHGELLTNANPMYFDNSIFDFYASLFNGAALAPLPLALVQEPRALVEAVSRLGCTLWFSVPSLLIYLSTLRVLSDDDWPSMRTIVFGGEGYPLPELRKLHALFGHRARLVNVYGPTECTCICSAHDVSFEDLSSDDNLPPIGRLAPNFRGMLLNAGVPAGANETGELCLIGPNVGLGYYRDSERTAAAFVRNPFCTSHGEMLYRTGDLMRLDPEDGLLRYAGRLDNQIKHMGYRIELEEIEAALHRLDGVQRAVVVYKRSHSHFGNIVAFVAADTQQWSEARMQDAMRRILPEYMIPRRIEILDALPLNANGKIDRKQLLEGA